MGKAIDLIVKAMNENMMYWFILFTLSRHPPNLAPL